MERQRLASFMSRPSALCAAPVDDETFVMRSRHGRGAPALPNSVPEGRKLSMGPPDSERNQAPMSKKLLVVKEVQIHSDSI